MKCLVCTFFWGGEGRDRGCRSYNTPFFIFSYFKLRHWVYLDYSSASFPFPFSFWSSLLFPPLFSHPTWLTFLHYTNATPNKRSDGNIHWPHQNTSRCFAHFWSLSTWTATAGETTTLSKRAHEYSIRIHIRLWWKWSWNAAVDGRAYVVS